MAWLPKFRGHCNLRLLLLYQRLIQFVTTVAPACNTDLDSALSVPGTPSPRNFPLEFVHIRLTLENHGLLHFNHLSMRGYL
jgi:hypothetical protein